MSFSDRFASVFSELGLDQPPVEIPAPVPRRVPNEDEVDLGGDPFFGLLGGPGSDAQDPLDDRDPFGEVLDQEYGWAPAFLRHTLEAIDFSCNGVWHHVRDKIVWVFGSAVEVPRPNLCFALGHHLERRGPGGTCTWKWGDLVWGPTFTEPDILEGVGAGSRLARLGEALEVDAWRAPVSLPTILIGYQAGIPVVAGGASAWSAWNARHRKRPS